MLAAEVLVLLTLLQAHASQVFPQPVPLEEVVGMSAMIVVVERTNKPMQRKITIPDAPNAAPFSYVIEPLVVREVVHDPSKLTQVGATIEVVPSDLGMDYGMHVLYEVDGVMESPIVPIYESPVPAEATTWVAMISPCSAGGVQALCQTVQGARERVEALDRIRSMIGRSPTPLLPDPLPQQTPPDDPKKGKKKHRER